MTFEYQTEAGNTFSYGALMLQFRLLLALDCLRFFSVWLACHEPASMV